MANSENIATTVISNHKLDIIIIIDVSALFIILEGVQEFP